MGRPTKLTPKVQAAICEAIREGTGREEAARLAGVSTTTFHRWMSEGATAEEGEFREFREGVLQSEAELQREAVGLLAKQLRDSDSRLAQRAAIFILTHRFRSVFSSRQESSGPNGGPIEVESRAGSLSAEALAAMTPEQAAATIANLARREQ